MRTLCLISLFLISVQFAVGQRLQYPEVRRNESVVDDYYGTRVPDPYRHLEDMDSEEVAHFVEAQNNLTLEYLGRSSVRDEIERKLTQAYNYPKYGAPRRHGSNYFSTMNTGLQNQDVWYMQETLEADPRVFFDPNERSPNGTIAVSGMAFSDNGELAAISLNSKGSDWTTIHFRNTSSREDFPEFLDDTKFSSVAWSKDGLGVFYSRSPNPDGTEPEPDMRIKIYYHRVGSDQRDDTLLIEFDDPLLLILFHLTDDGNHLIIFTTRGSEESQVYYSSLAEQIQNGGITHKLDLVPIVDEWKNAYTYVSFNEGILYLMTNDGAPNNRLVGIELSRPDPRDWTTIIPEHDTNILIGAAHVDTDKLFVNYLANVRTLIEARSLRDGSLIQEIETPLGSTLVDFGGKSSDNELFFKVDSYLTPGFVYRVDLTTTPFRVELLKESRVPGFDPTNFITRQVFYPSKDGTRIPMYIIQRLNQPLDGNASTILYGYGGFGINILPSFDPGLTVFLQNFDGVYAVPNLRGGGEYGQKWHEAGRGLNKQNVFDDFIAAAEYLIEHNYTSKAKLSTNGASNGGLLTGACLNQRPDLYAAVVSEVGVQDMLRFQKFTVGYAWCPEYGCSDDGNQTIFESLHSFSPLHNVRLPPDTQVQYPPVLLTTADHDDRVVPMHSYKFAAEMQYKIGQSPRQTNPLLIRVYADAGHGGGAPIAFQIEQQAEKYTFLVESAGFAFTP